MESRSKKESHRFLTCRSQDGNHWLYKPYCRLWITRVKPFMHEIINRRRAWSKEMGVRVMTGFPICLGNLSEDIAQDDAFLDGLFGLALDSPQTSIPVNLVKKTGAAEVPDSGEVGDPDFDLDDRVPLRFLTLPGKKNGSLPVTRFDPVSPTTSSDVVLLDTSKNDVEMSVSKNLQVPLQQKFDPDVILEKKNVIVAEVVAQAKDKEFEKTLEEKRNLLDACHAVRKDLKTAHSSLQEQIIELERKPDRFLVVVVVASGTALPSSSTSLTASFSDKRRSFMCCSRCYKDRMN
uniref:Uncharacterized protein n=1 Tax=Populus alba TaxID=43335 RepID=A0A4U5PZU0_POPAL|nr:hypothetical protein D5086_0000160430 [Populus alba]